MRRDRRQPHDKDVRANELPSGVTVFSSDLDIPSILAATSTFHSHLSALAQEFERVVTMYQKASDRNASLAQELSVGSAAAAGSVAEPFAIVEAESPTVVGGSSMASFESESQPVKLREPGFGTSMRVNPLLQSTSGLLDDLPIHLSERTSAITGTYATGDASAANSHMTGASHRSKRFSAERLVALPRSLTEDLEVIESASPGRVLATRLSMSWANSTGHSSSNLQARRRHHADMCLKWAELTERLLHRSASPSRSPAKDRIALKSGQALATVSTKRSLAGRSASARESDTSSIRSMSGGNQLELWPEWGDMISRASTQTMPPVVDFSSIRSQQVVHYENSRDHINVQRTGDVMRDNRKLLQFWMVRPSTPQRIAWDMLSAILLCYDLIMIPLTIFPLGDHAFLTTMMWTSTVYWSLDIIASFLTGYHVNGVVELRPSKVAKHYSRTWFPLDIMIVTSDWLVLANVGDSVDLLGVMRIGKSFRLTRVLRAMRLLRILRYLRNMEVLWYITRSQVPSTMVNIAKFLLAMIVVNHFIACAWYGLGDVLMTEGYNSWLVEFRTNNEDTSLTYLYLTCLHWSLTQFTPASMEVVPRSSLERLFTIVVLVVSLVMLSSIISSITAAVTNLRRIRSEKTREREIAKQYLLQKRLPLEVGNNILAFLKQHYYSSEAKRLREQDVNALKILPEPLRMTLRLEIYTPVIWPCPLFRYLHEHDFNLVARTCHRCMSENCLDNKQEVFHCGQKAVGPYFITGGVGSYFKGMDMTEAEAQEVSSAHGRPFFAVAAMSLWVHWEHRGRLVGWNALDVVSLDGEEFRGIAIASKGALFCKSYAQACRNWLMHAGELTDLWDSRDVEEDLVKQAAELDNVTPSQSEDDKHKPSDDGHTLAGRLAHWLKHARRNSFSAAVAVHMASTPPPSPKAAGAAAPVPRFTTAASLELLEM
mmetsp:Transcript_28714/g.66639  ORF Transcript_28714/g.66639 Transcript_28714/m.66639 type:complete len:940 (-) Transcript_28714:125-2944(-)